MWPQQQGSPALSGHLQVQPQGSTARSRHPQVQRITQITGSAVAGSKRVGGSIPAGPALTWRGFGVNGGDHRREACMTDLMSCSNSARSHLPHRAPAQVEQYLSPEEQAVKAAAAAAELARRKAAAEDDAAARALRSADGAAATAAITDARAPCDTPQQGSCIVTTQSAQLPACG